MTSDQERKDEFLRLLQENKEKGREIGSKSGDLMQFGHEVADLAEASEDTLKYFTPGGIDWEPKIQAWRYVTEQQDVILRNISPLPITTVTSATGTASYSMIDFARASSIDCFVPPDRRDEARVATQKLLSVIDRQAEKGKVLSLLCQYGLANPRPGQESPAELFEVAYAAFQKPVTQAPSAATSLIPMRECINGTIAALLRRRPSQEPARSQHDKVLSICRQLAGSGVSDWAIQSLAQRWESLVDKLSDAKQRSYSREEWGDLLRQASLFLLEFLQSLDQSKMKQLRV